MTTVKDLIKELDKYPKDQKVYVEIEGSIKIKEIKIEKRKIPFIISEEDNDALVII